MPSTTRPQRTPERTSIGGGPQLTPPHPWLATTHHGKVASVDVVGALLHNSAQCASGRLRSAARATAHPSWVRPHAVLLPAWTQRTSGTWRKVSCRIPSPAAPSHP